MLPRLMAEESMQMMNRVAMGAGHLLPADRDRMMRSWQQTAHPYKRIAVKPTDADLERIGIQVVRVPKKPAAQEAHGH